MIWLAAYVALLVLICRWWYLWREASRRLQERVAMIEVGEMFGGRKDEARRGWESR